MSRRVGWSCGLPSHDTGTLAGLAVGLRPLVGASNWHTKSFEIRRPRDPARNRKWRVENTVTGEAYDIVPGASDGVATSSPDWPFPRGDVWILKYRGSEIDDGSVATGPPYEANLDAFVNGEAISNSDVVVWYGAHFTHDVAGEGPGPHGHIVGPTLSALRGRSRAVRRGGPRFNRSCSVRSAHCSHGGREA